MSYYTFSLHKKSQHRWYLGYTSSRIFQKGIIYRIHLLLPIHFTDKFLNVSNLLLVDCFLLSKFTKYLDRHWIFAQLSQGINFPIMTK